MSPSTQLYDQLFTFLRQHSCYKDFRHLKTLAWMVSALICSGQLNPAAWEPYVPSRTTQAQSFERRWSRFFMNQVIDIKGLYLPLVLLALTHWQSH